MNPNLMPASTLRVRDAKKAMPKAFAHFELRRRRRAFDRRSDFKNRFTRRARRQELVSLLHLVMFKPKIGFAMSVRIFSEKQYAARLPVDTVNDPDFAAKFLFRPSRRDWGPGPTRLFSQESKASPQAYRLQTILRSARSLSEITLEEAFHSFLADGKHGRT